MTLREFARLLALCANCGKRGGHTVAGQVVECLECGHAWPATVPLCFEGPPAPAPTNDRHELTAVA